VKTDRDVSIERLLRSLRPQEPAGGDCPDVEALAALADNGLSAADRQAMETHIADCHRCQALTAAMARTASAAPPEPGANRVALPWWKSRRTLNWLVPAAAAATAVAVWVAVPGQSGPLLEQRQAEVQTAAAPAPDAAAVPPAEPAPPAPTVAPEPNTLTLGLPSVERTDAGTRSNGKDTAFGATASPDAQPTAAAAESVLTRDEASQERAAAQQNAAPADADRSLVDRSTALGAARAAAAPIAAGVDVVSSDPQIRWRVGPGAQLQYSADGGSTFAAQQTGASAPLTAGSSPSPLVCWIVGRAGAVLRTSDGGRQWQRVAFPEAVDLVAVRASNALTATVNLADGRRLGTTDGGQTWTPARE
jgi:hypothetical protein